MSGDDGAVRISPRELHDSHRWITLDEVNHLPGNPNLGDEESLTASIDEFGWFDGIVVHEGVVIAGNHRVDAARAAGEDGLPGYDLSRFPLGTARRMAMALAHNHTTRAGVNDEGRLVGALRSLPSSLLRVAGFDQLDARTRALIDGVELNPGDVPVAACPVYRQPFQWFGGKSRVAPWVWAALGDVDNYVEPFAGSLAMLMRRPVDHRGRSETVNDIDGFVANFWRAAKADPVAVAEWCNWPVNESDLHARRAWLADLYHGLPAQLEGDPEWFDARIAGWWAWAQAASIGAFRLAGPWRRVKVEETGTWRLERVKGGVGVHRGIPNVRSAQGVNRDRPNMRSQEGVTRSRSRIGERDVLEGEGLNAGLHERMELFNGMAERLRHVRVCTGDWGRVCTNGVTGSGDSVGVFLDPPYSNEGRSAVYIEDDGSVAEECRNWALEHGDDARFRIVLAGYVEEHDEAIPDSWTRLRWSTSGGMSRDGTRGRANSEKECLWLSPFCYRPPEIPEGFEMDDKEG